jgi:integrase
MCHRPTSAVRHFQCRDGIDYWRGRSTVALPFNLRRASWTAQFEITPPTRDAVTEWIKEAELANDDYLFPSRVHDSPHLGTRQYARILDSWIEEIGLDPTAYGTHTMRRTKASLIYRRTKNIRAVQLLLGHTKLESTVRYLGIEVEDALELSEQTEI